ncbi:MAG: Lrp/AsnC ligand binding domain-containing protein [Candidatus Heimdallarchaeota archaeon]|nr:MAG: Lrp/AsnC ligand binding domain-containing protein [Candidatus Heimdallarchaeota archaeon]
MPAAFVLVNAEIGSEDEVLEDLKTTKGVVGAWIVYGVYDIVAKIEAETMDELKEIITTNIRGLENVRSTLTMIVVEGANE